jgi:hypothetical protein
LEKYFKRNYKRNEATRSEHTDHFNALIVMLHLGFNEGKGEGGDGVWESGSIVALSVMQLAMQQYIYISNKLI